MRTLPCLRPIAEATAAKENQKFQNNAINKIGYPLAVTETQAFKRDRLESNRSGLSTDTNQLKMNQQFQEIVVRLLLHHR